jgi:hypothetical protein
MRTATLKVSETLAQISAAVEAVKNDQLQHFSAAAAPGDSLRQGDVVLQFLGDGAVNVPPHIYQKLDEPVLQLAPGNSKGSRHILASADGVEMWAPVPTDEAVLKCVYAKHGKKVPKNVRSWELDFTDERSALERAMLMAGPIFTLHKENVLTHPEHGDWALPCGTYRVIFQRTLNQQQHIARVLD